jgi:hypothetical protein
MVNFSLLLHVVASKDDIVIMNSDGAQLISAAAENDHKKVKKFISDKVDVNSRVAFFFISIYLSHFSFMSFLLL